MTFAFLVDFITQISVSSWVLPLDSDLKQPCSPTDDPSIPGCLDGEVGAGLNGTTFWSLRKPLGDSSSKPITIAMASALLGDVARGQQKCARISSSASACVFKASTAPLQVATVCCLPLPVSFVWRARGCVGSHDGIKCSTGALMIGVYSIVTSTCRHLTVGIPLRTLARLCLDQLFGHIDTYAVAVRLMQVLTSNLDQCPGHDRPGSVCDLNPLNASVARVATASATVIEAANSQWWAASVFWEQALPRPP